MAMKIRKTGCNFKTIIKEFENYCQCHEQHHKIFSEPSFAYPRLNHAGTSVEDGCDGFCPECEQMLKCEVYNKELKLVPECLYWGKEWEWIYS